MPTTTTYARRREILASPRESTMLPAGDPRRSDRYRRLATVARFAIPRRIPAAQRDTIARAVLADVRDRLTFS